MNGAASGLPGGRRRELVEKLPVGRDFGPERMLREPLQHLVEQFARGVFLAHALGQQFRREQAVLRHVGVLRVALVRGRHQFQRELGRADVDGLARDTRDFIRFGELERGIEFDAFARDIDGASVLVLREQDRDPFAPVPQLFVAPLEQGEQLAILRMHPERYNLQFPKITAKPGSITLKHAASIAELTVCLGQDGNQHDGWFRTLRNLNPQLDPQQSEPVGARIVVPEQLEKTYQRDCADGRWQQLAAELHAAVVPTPAPVALTQASTRVSTKAKDRTYVVRKGDTLAAIARKGGGCSGVREIAVANGLRGPHFAIKPGQTLKIPECRR